jgi:hypothetical protein
MLKPYKTVVLLCFSLCMGMSNTVLSQTDVQSINDVPEQHDQTTHFYSTPSVPVGGGPDDTDANPPELGGDAGAPIDGGLSVLLAAGAAYGVKRMRKKVDGPQSTDHS